MNRILNYLRGKKWNLPHDAKIKSSIEAFSITEKVLFYVCLVIFALSTLFLLNKVNDEVSIEIPAKGGTFTEGLIGSPRFINPLLAISDTDRDLVSLVYSGLLRATPSGELVPDLAESYTISNDGLTYSFILKENTTFQDGAPVTADDVIFTVKKAQDPNLKSPKRANWDSVEVTKVSAKSVTFLLKQPYAPFLENTTLGILPKHIWKDLDNEQFAFSNGNTKPIGSGPYHVVSIEKNDSGIPISYTLESFKEYINGTPYIKNIIFTFFQNNEDLLTAYKNNEIESVSTISPEEAKNLLDNGARVEKTPLSRIFGVFFNQNQQPIFTLPEVRRALDVASGKERITNEVLLGYGTEIHGPTPPGIFKNDLMLVKNDDTATTSPRERAALILKKAGWEKSTTTGMLSKSFTKKGSKDKETRALTFSLATANTPELKKTAMILKEEWEAIGAKVEVKIYEPGNLNQEVIRPRKYDALLFGEIVGRNLDLFAFWHSSQRNDPGLNIALYTNIKADAFLEQSRTATTTQQSLDLYKKFQNEIETDRPAVFLYSPDFIYIIPKTIQGFSIGEMTSPSERFLGIKDWYIETDKVWKIFVN